MIRFYIALWVSKFVAWVHRLQNDERNDRPGLYAFKLCPDFLARVAKPKLVITITGTNGKTTTTSLIAKRMMEKGYKVTYNDWGANLHAGYAYNLLRSVSIFNKPKVDVSILEADENTLAYTMGMIEPNYILVLNVCKDSLRRNGHPEYIFDCINKTFEKLGSKTTAILNANDPISSQLAVGTGAKRLFFGMADAGTHPFENMVRDIWVCPNCGEEIEYNYRFYRHIGDFYCPNCDFRTPEAHWFAGKVDLEGRRMEVTEDGETTEYPLIDNTVFNAFNVLAAVSTLRLIGDGRNELASFMETQKLPEIRETCVEYDGIKYYTYGTKSQNVSAAATVFEYMAKEPSVKDVVFCLDEVQDVHHPTETISWLYETDYEFLNSPNIRKIVVGGHMFLNHKLRLLLAGIPEDKIVCVEKDEDVPLYVDTEGIEKVYVLFEIDCVTKAANWRDAIVARAKEVKGI